MGQSEIQSSIVEGMDELKELIKLYIRFASVYTNFKEIGEFSEYMMSYMASQKVKFKQILKI